MKNPFKVGDRVKLICNFAKGTHGTVVSLCGRPMDGQKAEDFVFVRRDPAGPNDCLRYHYTELEKLPHPNLPHKWATEIKAWADGAEIEYRTIGSQYWNHDWTLTERPIWDQTEHTEYRVYQEPKPDRIEIRKLSYDSCGYLALLGETTKGLPNLTKIMFTFDGETGKLKAAELIK